MTYFEAVGLGAVIGMAIGFVVAMVWLGWFS